MVTKIFFTFLFSGIVIQGFTLRMLLLEEGYLLEKLYVIGSVSIGSYLIYRLWWAPSFWGGLNPWYVLPPLVLATGLIGSFFENRNSVSYIREAVKSGYEIKGKHLKYNGRIVARDIEIVEQDEPLPAELYVIKNHVFYMGVSVYGSGQNDFEFIGYSEALGAVIYKIDDKVRVNDTALKLISGSQVELLNTDGVFTGYLTGADSVKRAAYYYLEEPIAFVDTDTFVVTGEGHAQDQYATYTGATRTLKDELIKKPGESVFIEPSIERELVPQLTLFSDVEFGQLSAAWSVISIEKLLPSNIPALEPSRIEKESFYTTQTRPYVPTEEVDGSYGGYREVKESLFDSQSRVHYTAYLTGELETIEFWQGSLGAQEQVYKLNFMSRHVSVKRLNQDYFLVIEKSNGNVHLLRFSTQTLTLIAEFPEISVTYPLYQSDDHIGVWLRDTPVTSTAVESGVYFTLFSDPKNYASFFNMATSHTLGSFAHVFYLSNTGDISKLAVLALEYGHPVQITETEEGINLLTVDSRNYSKQSTFDVYSIALRRN